MSTIDDEEALDLASRKKWEVVPHEHAAVFWVLGNCMNGDGISDGDIVLVDAQRKPEHGDIGVFFIRNERGGLDRTLRRLDLSDGTRLIPSNPAYAPVVIDSESDLFMVGTVFAFVRRVTWLP